jgi:hypothetical protein
VKISGISGSFSGEKAPMRVALGTFAHAGIEAHLGPDIAAGVQSALLHYTHSLGSARAPARFPRFRRDQPPETSGADFDLTVDPAIQEALERELRKPGGAPSMEQLAAHAVFVYLADLEEARPSPRSTF